MRSRIALVAFIASAIAATLLFVFSIAVPGSGKVLAIASSALAVLSATAASILVARKGAEAERRLSDGRSSLDAALDALSSGLVRLSTGDLAAFVPQPSFGEDSRAGSTESKIRECVEAFDAVTEEPSRRFFYVGSDSYEEGRAIGRAIGKKLGGSGRLAILLGDFRSVNYSLRRRGVVSLLAEEYPGLSVVDTVETGEFEEHTYKAALDLLTRFPGLEAMYVAQGATPSAAARAVVEANRIGKTFVFGHDFTDKTAAMIAKGVIAASLSQDPYAQGYEPAIRLYNYVAAGWRPSAPRLLTRLGEITQDNYKEFADQGGSSRSRKDLILPAKSEALGKKLRIAIVLPTGDGFWAPVRRGAEDAGKELASRGVELRCFFPPPEQAGDRRAAVFAPILKRLEAEGWNAVALPIFDRALIPALNAWIARGAAAATLNCEPVSLRETVTSIRTQAEALITVSGELAASAEESGQSTAAIGQTLARIGENVAAESREVERTSEELASLTENVGEAKSSAERGVDIAGRVATASRDGKAAVSGLRATIQSLKEASSFADSTIRELEAEMGKIGVIVGAISELANQTNVLAINASIQAARAGEQGKGFAVIAAEIRKLAEQSNRSAAEISTLIARAGERVRSAAEATSRGLSEAETNAANAEKSEKSLVEIDSLAVESERSIAVILQAVQEIVAFSAALGGAVRRLSEANKGSSAAASEIELAAREMSGQAADVANTAQALSEMASSQQVFLSQFRLGRED